MYEMMKTLAEYILQYGGYFEAAWAAWSEKYNPPPDSAPVLRAMGEQLCMLGYNQVQRVPEPMYRIVSKSNIPDFRILGKEEVSNG